VDKVKTANTYQVISVTATTIIVKDGIDSRKARKSFGLICGQKIMMTSTVLL